MTAVLSTAEAIAASEQLGHRLGLRFTQAELIAEGYSVRVRLGPALSRVITDGCRLRGDPRPWLRREVAVAGWLAARGAAVARPWSDPGPHEVADTAVSLWTFEPLSEAAGAPSPAQLGQALAQLHGLLADCPLKLPLLAGPLADIHTGLRLSRNPLLHRTATRLLPELDGWPRRPLHGDVHPGNLLHSARGWLWTDFEDACLGPPEWDLASTQLDDEALRAYGQPLDRRRLQSCRRLRRLQILASLLVDGARDEELPASLLSELQAPD